MSHTKNRPPLPNRHNRQKPFDWASSPKARKSENLDVASRTFTAGPGGNQKRPGATLGGNSVKRTRVDAPYRGPSVIARFGSGFDVKPATYRSPTSATRQKPQGPFLIDSSDEDDEDSKPPGPAPAVHAPPSLPHKDADQVSKKEVRRLQKLQSEQLRADAKRRKEAKEAGLPTPLRARPVIQCPQTQESIDLTSDDAPARASPSTTTATQTGSRSTTQVVDRNATHDQRASSYRQPVSTSQTKPALNGSLPLAKTDSLEPVRRPPTPSAQRKDQVKDPLSTAMKRLKDSRLQHQSNIEDEPSVKKDVPCAQVIGKTPPARMPWEAPAKLQGNATAKENPTKPQESSATKQTPQIPSRPDELNARLEKARKDAQQESMKEAQVAKQRAAAERIRLEREKAEKMKALEEAKRLGELRQRQEAQRQKELEVRRQQEAAMNVKLKEDQQRVAQEAEKRRAAAAAAPKPPPVVDEKAAEAERQRQERIKQKAERNARRRLEDLEDEQEIPVEAQPSPPKFVQPRAHLQKTQASFGSTKGNTNGVQDNGPRSLSSLAGQAAFSTTSQTGNTTLKKSTKPKPDTPSAPSKKGRDRYQLPENSEIVQSDAQLLYWRDRHERDNQETQMYWPEILPIYEKYTGKVISETTLRARYKQVSNAIKDAGISLELMDKLRAGDVVAKRQINRRVHGRDLNPEPQDPEHPFLKVSKYPYPKDPEVALPNIKLPTLRPQPLTATEDAVAPLAAIPRTAAPSGAEPHPTTGGKSLDWNTMLHYFDQMATEAHGEELEQEDDEDEGEFEQFEYHVFRRMLSPDQWETFGIDPESIDDIPSETTGKFDTLEDANGHAWREIWGNRRSDNPRWLASSFDIEKTPWQYGMNWINRVSDEYGTLQVWVDRQRICSEERLPPQAITIPKTVFVVKSRTTITSGGDDLFEEDEGRKTVTEKSYDDVISTDLEHANLRAIRLFVDVTYLPTSPNHRLHDMEKTEEVAKLTNVWFGDDIFHGEKEVNGGKKKVEVWVQASKIEGPRNI